MAVSLHIRRHRLTNHFGKQDGQKKKVHILILFSFHCNSGCEAAGGPSRPNQELLLLLLCWDGAYRAPCSLTFQTSHLGGSSRRLNMKAVSQEMSTVLVKVQTMDTVRTAAVWT